MRSFTALLLVGLAVHSVEAFAPVLELHNVPVSAGSVKLQPRHAVRVKPRRSRKARLASPKAVAGKQSSPHSKCPSHARSPFTSHLFAGVNIEAVPRFFRFGLFFSAVAAFLVGRSSSQAQGA